MSPLTWSNVLEQQRPLVCGILNVTPDSFSDGGSYVNEEEIIKQINAMVGQGAKIIDVGAESTRLGAHEVFPNHEIARLENIVRVLAESDFDDVLFSIDTRHHETAKYAMENGFQIINDVSGATFDEQMLETMSLTGALVILMHSRGTPETMGSMANYEDIVKEVTKELSSRVDSALKAGIGAARIMIDPGIGFAKTSEQSFELLEGLPLLKVDLNYPVMVGISRKTIVSFKMSGDPQAVAFDQRDDVSADMCKYLFKQGADVVRVHNVAKTVQSLNS